MKQFSEDRMEELFAPLREREAPARLRETPVPVSPAAPRRFLRPLVAGVAGIAVMAVGAVIMWPRPASAAELMAQLSDGFVGSALIYEADARGGRRLVGEGWFAKDAYRLEGRSRGMTLLSIYNAREGFEMSWSPEYGTMLWLKPAPSRHAPFPLVLDAQSLLPRVRNLKVTEMPPVESVTFEGKPALRVRLVRPQGSLSLYADPRSRRLIGLERKAREPDGRMVWEITKLSPEEPSRERFRPVLEFGGRRFDVREERERIRRELDLPVATYPVADGKVAIRRMVMNRRGDLFLLYSTPPRWAGAEYVPGEVTDDAGGRYIPGPPLRPYLDTDPRAWRGYTFGDDRLRGRWYLRLGAGKPKNVRVVFHRESPSKTLFEHRQPLPVISTDLPDFMPFMAGGYGDGRPLDLTRAAAWGDYYRRQGRWKDAEAWIRRSIPTVPSQGNALEGEMRKAHLDLAEVLARQGRREAARKELASARKLMRPGEARFAEREFKRVEKIIGDGGKGR
jgi:hypothetical protein